MEPLFRLTLKRPAVAQDPRTPSIPLAQPSPFQQQLAAAQQDGKRREALRRVAHQFIASPGFVADPKTLPVHDQLIALGLALDGLEAKDTVSHNDVAKAIQNTLGQTVSTLLSGQSLDAPTAALKDSIVAIKQVAEEHSRPIEVLSNFLRDLELVRKVGGDNAFPGTGEALRRYRRRSIALPTATELKSILTSADRQKELDKQREAELDKRRKEAEGKLDLFKRLNAAVNELTALGPEHIDSTPQAADAGFMVPTQFRPTELAIQELTRYQQTAQLGVLRARAAAVDRPEEVARLAGTDAAELPVRTAALQAITERKFMIGKGSFTPAAAGVTTFKLKAAAERQLSGATAELLKARGLSVATNPLDAIVESLRLEALSTSAELDNLLGRPVQKTFKRAGRAMVMISTPLPTLWNSVVTGNALGLPLPFLPPATVPTSHGTVAPAGVADLLVVKQQLVRYEGADVAHIENVLKGEHKSREHSRRRETEEISFRESEITTSEERELESTSRFEMSRETSETIREDASLKAGLSVSGKYGPTVEFSASAEGSVSRSKEEATKSASTFSQDVTERSATKVTERVLERSSLRVTNEVIEKNTHGIDNAKGTGHISGVYQWVNKVYQAQMFNYGIRMLYDFMVAEPAAFLISALENAHANAVELEKPMAFTLRPDQIDEWNYHDWVKRYGATDVAPPPEIYRTKSLDFKAGGGESDDNYNHSGQITIDDGYKAVYGTVGAVKNLWDDAASVDVVLGRRTHRFPKGDWLWGTNLDEERDSLPFALNTFKISDLAVAVEVKCQRTDRAMLKWRLETHAKLTTAYKARLSEYEEKLTALEVQAGVAIRGRNPLANLELMNDELKKHCISILTEQHYDLFDAVQTGAYNVPQLNLPENAAEGPYVRFFEQAFEWEQMTWLTYPYFWGRKSQWAERISYEDTDPVFNQFLKAGYCRVNVPVRPGFEGALDHFMVYGEIWNGGPLPAISNPLYLPIADEIAERLDRPGDEVPQGDPWLVRIPTTLVHLRPDDKLPVWQQNAAGDWVEV